MNSRKTFGDRVKEVRERKGMSQVELGKRVGVSQATITKIESGGKTKHGWLIASALGVPFEYLETGFALKGDNFDHATTVYGRVPVVSWVQAGAFTVTPEPWDADEWIETTTPIMRYTFALKIRGDSMEPSFPEGSYVVVEPDLEAQAGDYVIASKDGEEATFKQLFRDGSMLYLKPLNPRYPIMPLGEAKIVGVVRQMTMKLK